MTVIYLALKGIIIMVEGIDPDCLKDIELLVHIRGRQKYIWDSGASLGIHMVLNVSCQGQQPLPEKGIVIRGLDSTRTKNMGHPLMQTT